MNRKHIVVALAFGLGVSITSGVLGQRREHYSHSPAAASTSNCYDPSDPTKLRLWEGEAPGAVGNDPCRDIPYMQVFSPSGDRRFSSPAILIIPGGGYDSPYGHKGASACSGVFCTNIPCDRFRAVLPPGRG